ncbi:MAG: entericidin A/B family lipoprotein [Planctomycetes bacterium]|nr:entericidin A/B family lipoprotein [Planctomycetota bacterium]
MQRLRRQIVMMLAALALLALASCNTIHGAGKDIEKGGEAIQDASE